MFSKDDIATYYNHTLLHYKIAWQLRKSKGLHYGLWYKDTTTLHEAIQNTNRKVGEFINNDQEYQVMDAGCGVGGSAIFLASEYNCRVKGITLSKEQFLEGQKYVQEAKLDNRVQIAVEDYTSTSFPDQSFDLVFGIESYCHARPKSAAYKEAFRLLKPGGKLIIIDNFETEEGRKPKNKKTINKLLQRWAISDVDSEDETILTLQRAGFDNIQTESLTKNIIKSINRIYTLSLLGIITIPLYFLVFPRKYHFSRRHPESGWALYKCYHRRYLDYMCVSAIKTQ